MRIHFSSTAAFALTLFANFSDSSSQQPNLRQQDSDVSPRIINGNDADEEDYKSFIRVSASSDTMCGAVLVDSNFALTAAHCQFFGAFNNGVRIYNPRTERYDREVDVEYQFRHPNFDWFVPTNGFDIMVLKLATTVTDFDPIEMNFNPAVPYVGEVLMHVGYGSVSDKDSPELSNVLQEAQLVATDNNSCETRWNTYLGLDISDTVLCTDPELGSVESSSCSGDSGGPLYTTDASGRVDKLVGISSFGDLECSPDIVPDGFARISAFEDFIKGKICHHWWDSPLSSLCDGFTPPAHDPRRNVDVELRFTHGAHPEMTTFFVRKVFIFITDYVADVGPVYIPEPNDGPWTTQLSLEPGDYLFEVWHPAGDRGAEFFFDGSWELFATYPGSSQEVELAKNGASFADIQATPFTIEDRGQSPTPPPTPPPTTNSDEEEEDNDSEEEGGNDPGFSCIWTAWLEQCTSGMTLVYRRNLEDFYDEFSDLGDDGYHLVAGDYEEGVGWMGFFQMLPGGYSWNVRLSWSEFMDEAESALEDGYRAETLITGKDSYGNTAYLSWFRYDPSSASSWRGRLGNANFDEALEEMRDEGMHMTAGLGKDNGYWFAWFEGKLGPSRWSRVSSITDLQDVLREYREDDYYVSEIIHSAGNWVVWGERLNSSGSGWATRNTRLEIWEWIEDNWHRGDTNFCVTALTHGCGSVAA